jgi:tRNA A-37 threonylcarbamoyl transferase component Bud32
MSGDRASQTGPAQETYRDGWNLALDPSTSASREALVTVALAASEGRTGTCVRRTLRTETWLTKLGETDLFVKVLRPVRGVAGLKRLVRGRAADHVAAIARQLRRDGFDAPLPVLWGSEARTGREIIVTERARGIVVPRFLREKGRELHRKRAMLSALGVEIARLHAGGYLHGDLTPFNILISLDAPGHFILLDHERTRKTWLARLARRRLRNLVQLGHFTLPGLTHTDRMRVWRGYSRERGDTRSRELRRVVRMIQDRIARDSRKTPVRHEPMVARGELEET